MNDELGALFVDFLREAEGFQIIRNGTFDFEAKQRMIERADAHALSETYRRPAEQLWFPPSDVYLRGLERAETELLRQRAAANASAAGSAQQNQHTTARHQQEIVVALFSFTLKHLEARRLSVLSFWFTVAAVVVAVAAIVVTIILKT